MPYGTVPSTTTLVNLFCNKVPNRTPKRIETDFWVDIIDSRQQSRAEVPMNFSESPENQARMIGAIQNGIEYPYCA